MSLSLTTSGKTLLKAVIAGEARLLFSSVQMGNGTQAPSTATALSNRLMNVPIGSIETEEDFVVLRCAFDNADVAAAFRATELGVFAQATDGSEILYAYQFTPDGEADYIPTAGDRTMQTSMEIYVYVGDAENVTANITPDAQYVTRTEFGEFAARSDNPHRVTKEQIGLGNVPNVATNDQTPTYAENAELTDLRSGEKLSTAFGKLRSAVASLISHLGSDSSHVSQTDRKTWNGKAAGSHTHSAADINTGVLGVARGGTGVATYAKLNEKLLAAVSHYGDLDEMTRPGIYQIDVSACQNAPEISDYQRTLYDIYPYALFVVAKQSSRLVWQMVPTANAIYWRAVVQGVGQSWHKIEGASA